MRKSRVITLFILAFVLVVVVAPGDAVASTAHQDAITYVVQSGDSLSRIAGRYGSSVSAIVQANRLSSTVIYPGQALVIPTAAGAAGGSPAAAPRGVVTGSHIVRAGESLWSIASRYGVSLASLRALNSLAGDVILPGQTLSIPSGSGAAAGIGASSGGTPRPPSGASGCPASYEVRAGDTLSVIAARCGVSVARLMRANGLAGSTIYRGQWLQIPSGSAAGSSFPASPSPSGSAPGWPSPATGNAAPPSSNAGQQPDLPVVPPFPTPVPPFPPLSYPPPAP